MARGPTSGRARSTRKRNLDGLYRRYMLLSIGPVALLHAIVIYWLVTPDTEVNLGTGGREMAVVDMPPETRIPPPPEEIARPATPVLSNVAVAEDVTIAETVLVEDQPLDTFTGPPAPPAPEVEDASARSYSFTPYTVKPRCRKGCAAEDVVAHIPPILRKVGLDCSVKVGIRIDVEGRVLATDLLESSGNPACDAGVREWAMTTSWTTAYNRDQPVVVWIAQPVQLVTSR